MPNIPSEKKCVADRLSFFHVIEHEQRNLRLANSFTLKLESPYKRSFPKNQNSSFRLFSIDSSDPDKDIPINTITNNVPLHDLDATECITHIVNLSYIDYEDVWEVLFPRPIVTPKVFVDTELPSNDYL